MTPTSASPPPPCTVIVATRDRPAALGRCLEALAAQRYPADSFEVIVVDDGGSVDIGPVLKRFEAQVDVELSRQSGAGPSAARNRGAELARGSLLAFTDDDGVPDPGWLAALARRHSEDPGRGLGGRTVADRPGNPYQDASQRIIELAYSHYNADPSVSRFFAANNLALPADRFREIGGFSTELLISEDRDVCDRWVERGWSLSFVAEAIVSHAYPATLRGFASDHFHRGAGALAYHRARRRRGLGLSGLDPSFYAGLLRREALGALRGLELARLGLIAVWQAAYATGFAWAALKEGERRRSDASWTSLASLMTRSTHDRPRAR